jgi:hypothetical protein
MMQNYFSNVKRILGSLISNVHVREGWGKGNTLVVHFVKQNTKIAAAEKRGRSNNPSKTLK